MSGEMYVANESFVCVVDGQSYSVVGGVTRVRAGHPLLTGREHLFRVLRAHYEYEVPAESPRPVETATAGPGEVRDIPAKPAPAKKAAAPKPAQKGKNEG